MSNKQNLQENQAAEVIATTGAWVETNKKNTKLLFLNHGMSGQKATI